MRWRSCRSSPPIRSCLPQRRRHPDGLNRATDEHVRIDIEALTERSVTGDGQSEVTRELIDADPAHGLEIVWEAQDVALHDLDGAARFVTYAGWHR